MPLTTRALLPAAALGLALLPAAAAADPTITFRYSSYSPSTVRIEPGQSVTWRADPGTSFDALSGHPLQFTDAAIPPQADASTSTTRTFARVGRFGFSCRLHVQFNMAGAVLVSANHPPAAHLDAPSSAAAGAPVTLDGSGSSDPDPGQSLTYAWDVDGDGRVDQAGPSPVATTAYAEAGTHTARLTVTDSNAEPGIGPEASSATRAIAVGGVGAGSGHGGPGGGGPGAAAPTAVTVADPDAVVLRVTGSTRTPAVIARGLAVRVSNPEAAMATATLRFGAEVIGTARARLRPGGAKILRVRLNRRGRALLARKRRLRVELRVVLDDADSTGTTARRMVTLRR